VNPARRLKTGRTKAEQRSAEWERVRGVLRHKRELEGATRKRRRAELAELREECAERREAVKVSCAKGRESIRRRARHKLALLRAERQSVRERYSGSYGSRGRLKERRYTAAESDSLAEQNIPPELLPAWRQYRRRFGLDLQPDARAEAFLEFVEESPEVAAEAIEAALPSDAQLARAYARSHAEQAEAVPF
jgi:hypothetical protein